MRFGTTAKMTAVGEGQEERVVTAGLEAGDGTTATARETDVSISLRGRMTIQQIYSCVET